jgi:hypothetical protein
MAANREDRADDQAVEVRCEQLMRYGTEPGAGSLQLDATRHPHAPPEARVTVYRLPVLRLTLSLSCLNFLVPGPSPPGL